MPYRNPTDRTANDRARYERDGEAMRAAAKALYWSKQPEIRQRRKQLRTPERRIKDTADMRRRHAAIRVEMIVAYGGKCACCGEAERLFLELDHVESNGHSHRREIGRGSGATYRHLKKLGWPKQGYQLLCANCNAGRARNGGVCPHGR